VQQISLTSFGLRLPTRQLRQQNKKPATAKAGRAKLATGGARGDVVVAGLRGEPRGFHVIKIAGRPKENNSTNGCGSPPRRYRAPIRLDRQGWGLRSCGPLGLCHIVHAEAACRSMAWLIGFILTLVSSISTPTKLDLARPLRRAFFGSNAW
jgi:hypothetical protein